MVLKMEKPAYQHAAHPTRWLVLALVSVGTFMTTLDVSIVNVALPTLQDYFDTSRAFTQWYVLAYIFVITVLLPPMGRLGDIVGRRKLYTIGIGIFVAGSALCGAAMSSSMLIFSRAVQAIGSSIIMSSGPAIITEAFPHTERGKSLGFIGMAVALGLLTGPIIGGLLVQFASWHWMFLLNIPIGVALAWMMCRKVRGFDERGYLKLDIPGAVLLCVSLAALMFGLAFGEQLQWTSAATISLFVTSLIATVLFVRLENRTAEPLFHPELFRNREFAVGAISAWANYAAIMPVSVFLPFYLEELLRFRPDQVGLILAVGPLTLAIVAPLAGSLSDKIGSRFLTTAGLLIASVGLVTLRGLTSSSTWLDVVWRLALMSLGSSIFTSPNSSAIMGSVEREQLGIASGVVALVRNLGMVSGVALAGAIIITIQSGTQFTGELSSLPNLQEYAYLIGLKAAFLAGGLLAFFGAFMSAMRRRPGDEEAFERMG